VSKGGGGAEHCMCGGWVSSVGLVKHWYLGQTSMECFGLWICLHFQCVQGT
jgi:hypothetical protein